MTRRLFAALVLCLPPVSAALAQSSDPPPELLSQYIGTYRMTDAPIDYVIALEDSHLTGKLARQPALDLFAESETKFFLKVVDAEIEFLRDPATHAVNRLILYQGDVQHEGRKQ